MKDKKTLTDVEFKTKLCRKHQMPIFKNSKQCPNCNGLGVKGFDKNKMPIPCECSNIKAVNREMALRKVINAGKESNQVKGDK